MNELCFLSGLTSAEWAAWVQAAGSIIAIFAAWWIGHRQIAHLRLAALEVEKAHTKAIANATYLICADVLDLLGEIDRHAPEVPLSVDSTRADRAFSQLNALISPSAPPESVWLLVQVQAQVSKLQTLLMRCAGRAKNHNSGVQQTLQAVSTEVFRLQLAAAKALK